MNTWQETTREDFWEMLEVLPPAIWENNAFAVGEPITHDAGGPVHSIYCQIGDRYFCTTGHLYRFNPIRYSSEIRQAFFGGTG